MKPNHVFTNRVVRFGFTLIELLVVVAIIGILASLLLPALSKARAKAQASVCSANLKQVYILQSSYADENNDFLPGNLGSNNPWQLAISWTDKVTTSWDTMFSTNPYIEENQWNGAGQVFFCPSSPIATDRRWKLEEGYVNEGHTTYFWLNNYARLGDSHKADPYYAERYHGGRMGRFDPNSALTQDWILDQSTMEPNADWQYTDYVSNHSDGANVLFVNGSVSWHVTSAFESEWTATTFKKATTYMYPDKATTFVK